MVRRNIILLTLLLCAWGTTQGAAPKSSKGTAETEQAEYKPQSYDQPINPDQYLIRPGEDLRVTFVKSELSPMTISVGQEGKLVHPALGTFDLTRKTLTEARKMLLPRLRELYSAADIELSVPIPYLVSISITGAVVNPGTYQAYTSQRVSDLITAAGGLVKSASTRSIQFLGGDKPIAVDLDRAGYQGDPEANPPLYAGFQVVVPDRALERVQVVGEVNHPRAVELVAGDDLSLLVNLAGGATHHAEVDSAYVLGHVDRVLGPKGAIKAGDIIVIPAKPDLAGSRSVTLFGAVNHPGRYDFRDSLKLDDLLKTAGGVTIGANEQRITIFRRQEPDSWGRLQETRYPISNFVDKDQKPLPVLIRAMDSIYVPAKVGYVKVSGKVRNPGLFPYAERKDVKFYVQAAGGIAAGTPAATFTLFDRVSGITSEVSSNTLVLDGDEVSVAGTEVTP